MANGNSKVLTAEQEMKLRQPIEEHVGEIQAKINSLREDGTDQVVSLQNKIDGIRRDKSRTKSERESAIAKLQKELETAKAVEAKNKDEISKLIVRAEAYLKEHFDKDYYESVKASCEAEKAEAKAAYQKRLAELEKRT